MKWKKGKKNNTFECSACCPAVYTYLFVCVWVCCSFQSWPMCSCWVLSRKRGDIKVVKRRRRKKDSIISGSNHALVYMGTLLPAGLMAFYTSIFSSERRLFYSLVGFITHHRRPYTLKAIIYCSISWLSNSITDYQSLKKEKRKGGKFELDSYFPVRNSEAQKKSSRFFYFFVYLPVLTFFFVPLCHEPPCNYPHTPLLSISHFSVRGGKKRISLAPVKEKYEDVENEAWRSTCIMEHNMTGMFCYSIIQFLFLALYLVLPCEEGGSGWGLGGRS
jgi:hypothetical protein